MSKSKENNDNLKELAIPYIGIKVESIPTILRILNESKDDDEFVKYFLDIGKQKKTATEYLASLRNLKLAERDKDKQTKILSAGTDLIKDDIELLYKNLSKHCLKKFPDLKIIRDILINNKICSLSDLEKHLEQQGYSLKRKATLSSYYKLFREAGESIDNSKNMLFYFSIKSIKPGEIIEYNQFYKAFLMLLKDRKSKTYNIKEFKSFLYSIFLYQENIPDKTLAMYLKILQRDRLIKLYQINPNATTDLSSSINIDGKYYYNFEVINNGS